MVNDEKKTHTNLLGSVLNSQIRMKQCKEEKSNSWYRSSIDVELLKNGLGKNRKEVKNYVTDTPVFSFSWGKIKKNEDKRETF